MLLAHACNVIERTRLNIELLRKHIHLLRGMYYQFRVSHLHQVFVTVGSTISPLANSRRHRVGHEDDPIEIVIALLDILQHADSLIHPTRKHIVLSLQLAVFHPQFLFRGRTEDEQKHNKTARSQSHANKKTAQITHCPLLHRRINAVVGLRLRIVYIVYFAHLFGNISVVYAAKVIKTSYLCTVFLSF